MVALLIPPFEMTDIDKKVGLLRALLEIDPWADGHKRVTTAVGGATFDSMIEDGLIIVVDDSEPALKAVDVTQSGAEYAAQYCAAFDGPRN